MCSLIVEALQKAFNALNEEGSSGHSHGYAFHCGEASGLAAVARVPGVHALALCDDISGAYEDGDTELMRFLLDEVQSRQRDDVHRVRYGNTEIHAPGFDHALQEALRSKESGNGLRCSLMIGFVVGLMYGYQGPGYRPLGAVRDDILRGYETGCDELLREAGQTLGFATRITDPGPFMSDREAKQHYEELFRMLRWVQDFGLRRARARNDRGLMAQAYLWFNYRTTLGKEDAQSAVE